MRALILLSSLVLLSACSDKKPGTAPPPAEPTTTAIEPEPEPTTGIEAEPEPEPLEPEPSAPAADIAAQDAGAAGDCVAACVARNQMRAVGPEQIEADCRAECGK